MKKAECLKRIRRWVRAGYGRKSALLRQMIIGGEQVTWANLSAWLHHDPKKRRMPRDVNFLGLVAAWRSLVEMQKHGKQKGAV